ncbi:hypothetical protein QEN19_001124 [Hanseniaspora menglaensis]
METSNVDLTESDNDSFSSSGPIKLANTHPILSEPSLYSSNDHLVVKSHPTQFSQLAEPFIQNQLHPYELLPAKVIINNQQMTLPLSGHPSYINPTVESLRGETANHIMQPLYYNYLQPHMMYPQLHPIHPPSNVSHSLHQPHHLLSQPFMHHSQFGMPLFPSPILNMSNSGMPPLNMRNVQAVTPVPNIQTPIQAFGDKRDTFREIRRDDELYHEYAPKEKKPKIVHACDKCGKVFKRKQSLQTHMNAHLNIRPFKCFLCTKTFNAKQNYVRHERSHIKRKPSGKRS